MEPSACTNATFDESMSDDYKKAVKLVKSGYRAIQQELDGIKKSGNVSKSMQLFEMATSTEWSLPPLLNDQKLAEFCALAGVDTPYSILSHIWYILESGCHELRLAPALKIQRETGHVVVMLVL